MTIALIVALLLGGGASMAAETVNPGNVLYPIKVNVNEQVRGALAFSDEAKAHWDARLAERRLEEAERLSSKAKLSAETRTEIEKRLDAHVQAFEEKAQALSAEGDVDAALEAHSTFESKLRAHAQVLSSISENIPDSRMHLEPIISRVQSSIAASATARAQVEERFTAEGGTQSQTAAEGKRKAAENKLAEVRSYIERMKTSVEGNAIVSGQTRLSAADAAFMRGDAHMEAGAFGKAFISYEEAMRVAQEAKVLISTSNRIKVDTAGLNLRVQQNDQQSVPESSDEESSLDIEADTSVRGNSGNASAEGEGNLRLNLGL